MAKMNKLKAIAAIDAAINIAEQLAKSCGAGAPGSQGFQPGNSCAGSRGSSSGAFSQSLPKPKLESLFNDAGFSAGDTVNHGNEDYYPTGKYGQEQAAPYKPSRELESIENDGQRVWQNIDGDIKDDSAPKVSRVARSANEGKFNQDGTPMTLQQYVAASKPKQERYRDRIEGTLAEAEKGAKKAQREIQKLEKRTEEIRTKFKAADPTVAAFKKFRTALEKVEKAHARVKKASDALEASRKKTARLKAKLAKIGKKSIGDSEDEDIEGILIEHRRRIVGLQRAVRYFALMVQRAELFS